MGREKEVNVVEHITVLREGNNGWQQELNLVSWYGQDPKFDIRWWSEDKNSSGKGITLRTDEMYKLYMSLASLVDRKMLGGDVVCD